MIYNDLARLGEPEWTGIRKSKLLAHAAKIRGVSAARHPHPAPRFPRSSGRLGGHPPSVLYLDILHSDTHPCRRQRCHPPDIIRHTLHTDRQIIILIFDMRLCSQF